MNKYISTALLIIALLGAYTYSDISLDSLFSSDAITGAATLPEEILERPEPITQESTDFGTVEVIFCPEGPCEAKLVEFIGLAEETLHCAFYDIGLVSVQEALKLKAEEIEVQVVTDDHYYDKFPEDFVKHDRSAYMHNKFCIADNNKVFTGSMNPTDNGANKNDNNILIMESTELAASFEAEFQELWNDVFKKGDSNPITVELQTDASDTIVIESYFCPDDECALAVESELDAATESIEFMTFSFTHDGMANSILTKYADQGVDVRGVFEKRQNSQYSKYQVFEFQEVPVTWDGNSQTMHHKVFIIDEKTVITGSMNPSNNGVDGNDETLLIIHSEAIAKEYVDEFERVWEEGVSNS